MLKRRLRFCAHGEERRSLGSHRRAQRNHVQGSSVGRGTLQSPAVGQPDGIRWKFSRCARGRVSVFSVCALRLPALTHVFASRVSFAGGLLPRPPLSIEHQSQAAVLAAAAAAAAGLPIQVSWGVRSGARTFSSVSFLYLRFHCCR